MRPPSNAVAPLRVGIIGGGFGARVVAPAFAAVEHCTVVDVVSARDESAVRALCRRDDVDLVGVHSPPFLHRTHVGYALDAGHAVLCDKPFGRNTEDATAMLADAESAGIVHLVDFEFRYDPMRVLLRELLAGDALGRIEHVGWTHLSARSRVPLRTHGWLFERSCGGGWIGAWGSHAVDTLRWLLGEELTVVASNPRIDVPERPDATGRSRPCDAEDGFSALLRSSAGTTVTIDSSFAATASLAPRLVVTTSRAVLEVTADARITVRHADGEREEHPRTTGEQGGDPHLEPMRRFVDIVCSAVRDGRAPTGAPTFTDGLACAVILDDLRG
jgi:predicted dehydrogenase